MSAVECEFMGAHQCVLVSSYKARTHVSRRPCVRVEVEVAGKALALTLPTDKMRELIDQQIAAVFDAEESG